MMESPIKKFCVYCHTNKTNGKRYVGITSRNTKERWQGGKNYKHNAHFTSAIKKYGWDGFDHEVIITGVDKEYAESFEKMLINLYHSQDRLYGYNKSSGGESASGVKFTEERKKKISDALTGIKRSEETRKKISESLKNRSPELVYKFSHCNKGKPSWNKGICGELSHSYGVKFTEERRKHISEALKGKPKSEEHRAKMSRKVRHIPTGKIYKSLTEASNQLGVPITTICNHCKGIKRIPDWEYVKEEKNA